MKYTFQIPTPQQVSEHLERHRASGPSRLLTWLPLVALGIVLLFSVTSDHPATLLLPWLALAVILVVAYSRVRAMRRIEQQVSQAQELIMLRHHTPALERTWRLLPSATTSPALSRRLVAFMAHCLDELSAYDAAISAYNNLIEQLTPQNPGAVQLQIQRAIAELQTDRLTDADDTLRRLRGVVGAIKNTATGAAFRLAHLFQSVCTNHFSEAAQSSDDLLDELRPLGVEAAYGHALMALCYFHLPGSEAAQQAQIWWSRATYLMPVTSLLGRFGELQPLAVSLEATIGVSAPKAKP